MADLTYTMDINGAPALTTLNKVESNLAKLKSSFSGMQGVLAGLFTTAVIGNALKFADNINDIAVATGVATQNVLGFNNALLTNGGNSESAAKMLVKLSLSVEEANSGALKLSDSFSDVGISLNDLKTLSDTDILNRTILGLSKISDASKRAALATQILGKGAKGIDFVGVGGDIGKATIEAAKYSASVEKAAQVQDKITQAVNNFQLALLTSLDPLLTFVAGLKPEQIEKFVEAIVKIGGAAASIAIVTKAITGLGAVMVGIGAYWVAATGRITGGITAISGGFASLSRTITMTFDVLKRYALPAWLSSGTLSGLFGEIGTTLAMLAKRFAMLIAGIGITAAGIGSFATGIAQAAFLIAGIATAAYAAAEAIDAMFGTTIVKTFSDALDFVWTKLKGFGASVAETYNKLKGMMGFQPEQTGPQGRSYSESDVKNMNDYAKQQASLVKAEREQFKAREKALNEFKLQQQQLVDSYNNQNTAVLQQLTFEKQLVGKSEEEVEVLRAKEAALNNQRSIIIDLQKEQTKLTLAMGVDNIHKNELDDLRKRYSEIGDTILKIQAETSSQQILLEKNVQALQSAKLLEQDRLNTIERITQQMEKQQKIDDAMLQIRQTAQGQLGQAQFEGAQMKRNPEEKQKAQIQEDARKAALEAGRAFAATFDGIDMGVEDSEKLAAGLKLIAQSYKEIADQQTANLVASRSWEQGWKTAFDNYMENATNAATRAGEVFSAVTSNMNSAIDNFVENGKFSFSDLATSIIKDLIKIELKAQAVKLLGMLGGGGGILSSIGSLFGFAEGGSPPINKPSIVGEKGPELFVPRSAGTIIPNGGGGGGVVNKTYITNNISAIDSKSVAQMFAENRKALLGTVQLAQKELPYGNR